MKKIIDGSGRLFGRVSVIDIFVVIVAAVLVIAAYAKFNVLDNPLTVTGTVEVTYTVRIPAVRMTTADLMHVGDRMYSIETGANVGTIKNIEVTDAYEVDSLVDGSFAEARIEERYDVLLTVAAQCSHSNGRYYADRSYELNANSENRMYTKYVEIFRGIIMTITAG